jgi:hypothetical protein
LAHARHRQATRIFCGHTHAALRKRDDQHGIDYFNCGAWIDAHPSYITVGDEGVQIHEYVERAEDLHLAAEQLPAEAEPAELADQAGLFDDGELDRSYSDHRYYEDGEFEGVAT